IPNGAIRVDHAGFKHAVPRGVLKPRVADQIHAGWNTHGSPALEGRGDRELPATHQAAEKRIAAGQESATLAEWEFVARSDCEAVRRIECSKRTGGREILIVQILVFDVFRERITGRERKSVRVALGDRDLESVIPEPSGAQILDAEVIELGERTE